VKLSHAMPDMAIPSLRRVEKALAGVCSCGGDTATLVRREIEPEGRPRYWTVWLQCDGCGRGTDGPLSVSEHWHWNTYAEWNPALREQWGADRAGRFYAAADQSRVAALQSRSERRAGYAEFCRTNPEWHSLRDRVLWRSRGYCEACLTAKAVTAHHLTYALGLLPPAWELRAVCQACHDRLHADVGGKQDEWCPRTVTAPTDVVV